MRRSTIGPRRFSIAELLALLLLLGGMLGGSAVDRKATGLLGTVGWDRTSAAVRDARDPASLLGTFDLELISRELRGSVLAAAAQPTLSWAVGDYRSVAVEACGVTATWHEFLSEPLRGGSFFTEQAEEEGQLVAVVSSTLAWQLFLSDDVVGLPLELVGKRFRIVGVYQDGSSALDAFLANGRSRVYVPIGALPPHSRGIFSIQVAGVFPEDLDRGLSACGRPPGGFIITGFRAARDLGLQKAALPQFLVACVASALAFVLLVRRTRRFITSFRGDLRNLWLREAALKRLSEILGIGAYAVGTAALIYLLLKMGRFRLTVPPEYVPDRLIDLGYYLDLVRRRLAERNQLHGFFPPRELLIAWHRSALQGWLAASGIAGLALLLHVRLARGQQGEHLVALGLELACAVLIATGASFLLGMPGALAPDQLLVTAILCLFVACFRRPRPFSGSTPVLSNVESQTCTGDPAPARQSSSAPGLHG